MLMAVGCDVYHCWMLDARAIFTVSPFLYIPGSMASNFLTSAKQIFNARSFPQVDQYTMKFDMHACGHPFIHVLDGLSHQNSSLTLCSFSWNDVE